MKPGGRFQLYVEASLVGLVMVVALLSALLGLFP